MARAEKALPLNPSPKRTLPPVDNGGTMGAPRQSKDSRYTSLPRQLNSVSLTRPEPSPAIERQRGSHALAPEEKSALPSPLTPSPIPARVHGSPASTSPSGTADTPRVGCQPYASGRAVIGRLDEPCSRIMGGGQRHNQPSRPSMMNYRTWTRQRGLRLAKWAAMTPPPRNVQAVAAAQVKQEPWTTLMDVNQGC